MALDLIGQATHFLTLAAEAEGKGRSADDLAFRRDVLDMRNCLLVEQPNGDFAQTMARQFLFSAWQRRLFDQLATSPRTASPRSPPRRSRKSPITRSWPPNG
jgi:ring-1,2-phenylacetyl-CoA epoxidase subunit PaaC